MFMKKFFNTILYLLQLIIVLNLIYFIIVPKLDSFNPTYYYKKAHDIDIVFVGPSTTKIAISPIYIWNKYHITSYNLGSSGQHELISFNIIKNIKKYKPKLIFFDITLLLHEVNPYVQNSVYKWYLNPLYRYQYLKATSNNIKYTIPLMAFYEYHTRYKSLTEEDWNDRFSFVGFRNNRNFIQGLLVQQQNMPKINSMQYGLDNKTILEVKEIVQYIKNNNLNVIFWIPPVTDKYQYRYDRAVLLQNIFKDLNIPFINFNNLIDNINFNYANDFADESHINLYGGEKVTDYLMEYAIKNYDFKKHHDDKYEYFNKANSMYYVLINGAKIKQSKSFQEWQNQAYYDNYTMLISTNGDNVLNRLPQDMKDKFKSLGLTKFETDKKNQKYVAIIDDNQVFFEEVSDKKAEYKGRMKNIVNLLVSSENKKATINVSGKPRAKNKYGINFVIYDKVNREIVDSIWIDPAKPNIIRR